MAAAVSESKGLVAETLTTVVTVTATPEHDSPPTHSHCHRGGRWWSRWRGQEEVKEDFAPTPQVGAFSDPGSSSAVHLEAMTSDLQTDGQGGRKPHHHHHHHHHHRCPFQTRYPAEEIADGQIHLPPELAYYGPRGYDPNGPPRFWRRYFYSETGHLFGEFDF